MYRKHPLLLSITGGLLLWAAWPPVSFTPLLFIAWMPLLLLERQLRSNAAYFGYTYLLLLIWNTSTTWWIWNSTIPGSIAAFTVNSLFMCLPWMLYRWVRRRSNDTVGYLSLLAGWMAFEFGHLQDWGLSWPWLTLGNAFADRPQLVQWYEWTGVSGGTLWVLLANILLFVTTQRYITGTYTRSIKSLSSPVAVLFLPLLLSFLLLQQRRPLLQQAAGAEEVVVVQPNVDPYLEKFAAGTQEAQIARLIALSESQVTPETRLVVWPETAIPVQAWENSIGSNYFYRPVWSFLQRHPQLSLYTGMDSYRFYKTESEKTSTARKMRQEDGWYDAYNTAALFVNDSTFTLYHKSRLVPGVETLPRWLNFLGAWFEDFGGISGTLGMQEERTVLQSPHSLRIAPAICYESIYGEFMTSYVRNGANVVGVITNDGWWGKTPGYRQHRSYAKLRAIENRRWVFRSANTGISCFIDPLGNAYMEQPWDQESAIRMPVIPNEEKTLYTRWGDWLYRISLPVLVIVLGYVAIRGRSRTHLLHSP